MEAVVAQKAPYNVNEEVGTKWWCACGRSQNQPYCDGAHRGTGLTPVKVEITQAGSVWYCGCKATARQPWCDGAHRKL